MDKPTLKDMLIAAMIVGALGAASALSYFLTNHEQRKKLDVWGVVGLLIGAYLSSVSAFILLVELANLSFLVSGALIIPVTLAGGSAGLLIAKPSLRKLGFLLEKEEKEKSGDAN